MAIQDTETHQLTTLYEMKRNARGDYRKTFARAHPEMTTSELMEVLGVSSASIYQYRHGMRHVIDGGAPGKGARGEQIISKKLNRLNIGHKLMPHQHKYDIQLHNGMKGDAKTAYKITRAKNGNRLSYFYQFKIRPDQDDLVDFYVLLIAPTKDFFVIPSGEVRSNIRIPVTWEDGNSKWRHYHDRFDLLKSRNLQN